jgi:hypothetical protein
VRAGRRPARAVSIDVTDSLRDGLRFANFMGVAEQRKVAKVALYARESSAALGGSSWKFTKFTPQRARTREDGCCDWLSLRLCSGQAVDLRLASLPTCSVQASTSL